MSVLDRQRLNDNLLDRLGDTQRRVGQLERTAVAAGEGGVLVMPGLMLRVLDAPPAPPAAGHTLIYAELDAGTLYVRAIDDIGTVRELANWL